MDTDRRREIDIVLEHSEIKKAKEVLDKEKIDDYNFFRQVFKNYDFTKRLRNTENGYRATLRTDRMIRQRYEGKEFYILNSEFAAFPHSEYEDDLFIALFQTQ